MKEFIATTAAALSVLSFSIGMIAGAGLMLAPAGKFAELALMLGLLAMWSGNLVSCLCNMLYLWVGRRQRWLKTVTLLQIVVALLSVAAFWMRGGAGGLL